MMDKEGAILQVETPNSEAAILARLIQAKEQMNREVAEYLLSIDFSQEDTDRMNFLAERARAGLLSAEEAAELDSYLHVGNLLTIMQSKARRYLKAETPSYPRP
jgi:hypothetical protein